MGGAELSSGERGAVGTAYRAHYQSLVRLAALLTADAQLAEEIAADALATLLNSAARAGSPDRALLLLRRRVVIRCRRATREGPAQPAAAPAPAPAAAGAGAGGFMAPPAVSAVLQALQALPCGQREAVILRHYLQLSEKDAAAVMGASSRMVRRLAVVSEALVATLTEDPAGPQPHVR